MRGTPGTFAGKPRKAKTSSGSPCRIKQTAHGARSDLSIRVRCRQELYDQRLKPVFTPLFDLSEDLNSILRIGVTAAKRKAPACTPAPRDSVGAAVIATDAAWRAGCRSGRT